jgi:mannose-6-phosphate isomerase-like protein (cupin superfamily)
MLIRDVANYTHERVIDRSLLIELLHPDKVSGAEGLGCSVAHAMVPAGEATLPHILNTSTELYYILEGTGEMHIGPEQAPVHSGQIVHIPPGARQFIRNTGNDNLVFLCIVAPRWQAGDEELVR